MFSVSIRCADGSGIVPRTAILERLEGVTDMGIFRFLNQQPGGEALKQKDHAKKTPIGCFGVGVLWLKRSITR